MYAIFITVWLRLCGFCYIFYSLVNIVYACYIYYSLVYVACAKCTFIAARCISVLYSLCLVRVVFVILVYVLCYIYNSSVYGVFAIFFIVWFLRFCYILQCSLYIVCYNYYSLVSVVFAISITVWFMLCMLYFL